MNTYKLTFVVMFLHNLTLTCSKSSLLVQFLCVFPGGKTAKACWLGIILVASNGVMQILTTFLLCRPSFVSPWPTLDVNDGKTLHCADWDVLQYPSMIGNIVTSCLVFFIPLPKLWTLPLPLKAKVSLFLIFGFGLL